ncbi:MAG: cadmium-translocating P-type ATPase, partial [Deferribacteraceae bacterium]|nr:cadmium-translocating P-type ATPase [Deferribacteraceae bacterium]
MELAIYIVAYILIGHKILLNTVRNVRKGEIFDENFLMVIASIGAFILGYYAEAVAVMLFYRVGEYFQERASEKATGSIQAMLDVRPEMADVMGVLTPAQEVTVGTVIRVSPGEKVPLDGVIIDGTSEMNTAALTGESAPRAVKIGDEVLAGFVNMGGLLSVQTTKEFGETVFSKVINMVKESHAKKARAEKFITRFARYYTPAVVTLAAFIALVPPLIFSEPYSEWVYSALVFLVISCPCALLISVPLSFFAGIGAAAKNGIFVKGGQYLEALAHVDSFVFDKTGTLTTGEFKLQELIAMEGFTDEEVLRYAAIAEQHSTHPIARCLVAAYNKPLPQEYTDYQEVAGRGIYVMSNGDKIWVGKVDSMDNRYIYVTVNLRVIGKILVGDTIGSNVKDSLLTLRSLGVKSMHMLSGDNHTAAKYVADSLPLDGFMAELMPADKLEQLSTIISKSKKTAF